MTPGSDNVQIIRDAYDAFARGDVPAVLDVLSLDVAWTEAAGFPYAGTYHGPDQVLENVFMRLGSEWDGFAAVPDEILDAGDAVVALGTYSGTYLETGRDFEARFAHVWRMDGGKATAFEQIADTALVQEALP